MARLCSKNEGHVHDRGPCNGDTDVDAAVGVPQWFEIDSHKAKNQ